MEELSATGTSMTDHTRAERLSANDLLARTEANRRQISPATEPTAKVRRTTDEPQTADQRLALIVVLLAGLFLLGVGAGWQPAEPDPKASSPTPVTETRTADAREVALTSAPESVQGATTH